MIKTMRNVMIVVAVLITNCQVSEKLYRGPTAAQTTIAMHATKNVSADPRISELYRANFRNFSCMRPYPCPLRAPWRNRPVASLDLFRGTPPPRLENGWRDEEERGGPYRRVLNDLF